MIVEFLGWIGETGYESLYRAVGIHARNHREQGREEADLGGTLDDRGKEYGNQSDDEGGNGACYDNIEVENLGGHQYIARGVADRGGEGTDGVCAPRCIADARKAYRGHRGKQRVFEYMGEDFHDCEGVRTSLYRG